MIIQFPVDNPRNELDRFAHQLRMRRHFRYFIFYTVALTAVAFVLHHKIGQIDERVDKIQAARKQEDKATATVDYPELPKIELAASQI